MVQTSNDDATDGWSSGWGLVVGLFAVLVVVSFWAFTENTSRPRAQQGTRVDPSGVYNPVTAGERLPDTFRQLLPRDAILPVYDPTFVAASQAGWSGDTDVIGVADGGEAKAYPVRFLTGREMVNDEINRKPIVVTW